MRNCLTVLVFLRCRLSAAVVYSDTWRVRQSSKNGVNIKDNGVNHGSWLDSEAFFLPGDDFQIVCER